MGEIKVINGNMAAAIGAAMCHPAVRHERCHRCFPGRLPRVHRQRLPGPVSDV